ncbi:class I SAM-dependent methyltransferase [Nocardioides sp. YIM B13467]|uniref:class I SAM-dependent methyltransferase n=1 Tax=Nocardioides sp. YIM B13467 TaxID=3366294 RepID=UPI00366DB7B2
MGFDVTAERYARFMGRYAEPLAPHFAEFARVSMGQRVLDVGCGPGTLTRQLVTLTEAHLVAAVDPSPPFIEAVARQLARVDVHTGVAEALPFADNWFDASLAQLVVHFMTDPEAGIKEMVRVTRPGGTVAACVWDGDTGAVAPFWACVHEIDPEAEDEAFLAGSRLGDLEKLFKKVGLRKVEPSGLVVRVTHPTFEDWWDPYTFGVGPAGDYVQSLDDAGRTALEEVARRRFGNGPFTVTATAWAARGTVA